MLTLMSKVAASILISASTFANPTTPKALPFGASAFVTIDNQIRVSVDKTAEVPVVVLLRNADNKIVFSQKINKKEAKYAMKLNVDELADGKYELEVKSEEGSIRKELNLSTQPAQKTSRLVAME
jgi:hypothetical protein